jgi:hypothetical protein
MDYTITHRDYVKSELDYRLNRIQSDLAGRRRRRTLTRRGDVDGLTWTKVR